MKKITKIIFTFLLCINLTIPLTSCGTPARQDTETSSQEPAQRDIFAMDTYMTIQAYGDQKDAAVEAAVKEIQRLDTLFSTQEEKSEIAILNDSGSEILSEDVAAVLEKSMDLYRDTQGLFDIAIYPLVKEWGFIDEQYQVPSETRIKELLKQIDAGKIQYDKEEKLVTLPDSMEIDLGGIVKGFTSSRIMEIFKQYKVTSGLVSLGGNVQTYGKRPNGGNWRVGIQNAQKDAQDFLGVIEVSDRAVITSGGYERYFEKDGKTYHHILDPRTGYPAESGLTSVSIVSQDGTLADGLSTSLFIMGKDKAIQYWQKHREEFDMILLDQEGQITISQGISQQFSSDTYEIKIVK
ncbi:MAG: FAD:protein FMN transferase [Eubacterium sp.]|nr:FAD:protein FMN transferase [Eubacterium sp.]